MLVPHSGTMAAVVPAPTFSFTLRRRKGGKAQSQQTSTYIWLARTVSHSLSKLQEELRTGVFCFPASVLKEKRKELRLGVWPSQPVVSSRDIKLKYPWRGWRHGHWLMHPLVGGPSDVLYVEVEAVIDSSLHDLEVLSASHGHSGAIFIPTHQISIAAS